MIDTTDIILCITLLTFILVIISIAVNNETQTNLEQLAFKNFKWVNESWNGYYSTKEYYCVWTKDLKPEEIATTTVHEKCHALAHKEYEHFCK